MKPRFLISGILGFGLICAPALAASTSSQGETSGPAAGKTTAPNTSAEKHAANSNPSAATGGAGVEGKRGAEAGHAPSGHQAPSNAH